MIECCMTNEALLNTELLPTEHWPDDKWIAARLKVPHEFRSKMIPQAARRIERKEKRGQRQSGDEIWMHVRIEEDVEVWREKWRSGDDDKHSKMEKESASISEENGKSG